MHPLVRLVGVLALLGLVGGLCVHYDRPTPETGPYPETDRLATDYGNYVGAETLLFGTVESVDASAERATIRVDSDAGAFEMTARGFTERVEPGGFVQVYGTLREARVIDAAAVVVVNPASGSTSYKYAVSAVGALLALAAFFRHWGIDWQSVTFEVRSDG